MESSNLYKIWESFAASVKESKGEWYRPESFSEEKLDTIRIQLLSAYIDKSGQATKLLQNLLFLLLGKNNKTNE